MNTLLEIQEWYKEQCNGDWEHGMGVKIDNIDNPGWSVKISIKETMLEGKSFSPVQYGVGDQAIDGDGKWLICRLEKGEFVGYGGPFKLEEILRVFLDWKNACRQI